MDEFPEPFGAKIKDRLRRIDRHMVVEQAARHGFEQSLGNRQLSGRGRAYPAGAHAAVL